MEPQNLWNEDPWKNVPEDDGPGENFVKAVLRSLQRRTVLRDIVSLLFGGFSSIMGGFMAPQSFMSDGKKNDANQSDE